MEPAKRDKTKTDPLTGGEEPEPAQPLKTVRPDACCATGWLVPVLQGSACWNSSRTPWKNMNDWPT